MARKKKGRTVATLQVISSGILDLLKRPIVLTWILTVSGLVALTAMSIPKLRACAPCTS